MAFCRADSSVDAIENMGNRRAITRSGGREGRREGGRDGCSVYSSYKSAHPYLSFPPSLPLGTYTATPSLPAFGFPSASWPLSRWM